MKCLLMQTLGMAIVAGADSTFLLVSDDDYNKFVFIGDECRT